jgi:nucleotide-binding universal stress UspA family protein
MKTVLLYANDDSGMESRLQAALDAARTFEAHITCVQVTPFDSFIMGDPFGGVYALPSIIEEVRRAETAHREQIEQRLQMEGVSWNWRRYDGTPAQKVIDGSRLVDLIVLSLPQKGEAYSGPLSMVGDVAIHARAAALAVPQSSRSVEFLGPAIVAWNGAPESSNALRLSLPMLKRAAAVHVVTVCDERGDFPATDAAEYLARHGLDCELHEWPSDERHVAAALRDAAKVLRAGYIVMGAYGHSRLSESVLGGTTREMLDYSDIPLVLAH